MCNVVLLVLGEGRHMIANARRAATPVRKAIDTVIASRCIESEYDLLHSDRDFDAFAKYLGLRAVV